MAELLFWCSLALLAYVSAGYPALVALWAAVSSRPCQRQSIAPALSVVIAVHNEAAHVERKLANLLGVDYPRDRLEILLGSDGSTDDTEARARSVADPRLRVFGFPRRRGKPAVLNALVPRARGEIVVLADVRQRFDPQALRALVQPFADPQVGAVSGELILTRPSAGCAVGDGAGVYWRYEKFIRACESRIDSTVGATGAVCAIRKSLFEPIPEDTVLDDVLIPLGIVRRGYRVLFEPGARVYDEAAAGRRQEFTRKVRTLAGNFQLFARERWLFNPARNRLWWQTVSHKGLRLLMPPLQAIALAANLAVVELALIYQLTLLAQLLVYAAAIAGSILQNGRRRFWPATVAYTFCLLSWATVVGFWRCITRRQTVTWEKAALPRHLLTTTTSHLKQVSDPLSLKGRGLG